MFRFPKIAAKHLIVCLFLLAPFVQAGGAAAGDFKVLYTFKGYPTDGGEPGSPLVTDKAGNIYGVTFGTAFGTIFKLAPSGAETLLYIFQSGNDGSNPYGPVMDAAGNLYGTTYSGGANNDGTVFKLAADGTLTVLHAFASGSDGNIPEAAPILDKAGNLYGTTVLGGVNNLGIVFKVASDGTETVLHAFAGGADGANPQTPLLLDSTGNLYGTTGQGGPNNAGTIFKIAPDGTEAILYAFMGGRDGAIPGYGALIADKAGNLYGTTAYGGINNCGTIYKLAPEGVKTLLHTFTGGKDGSDPIGGLTADGTGELYGTTAYSATPFRRVNGSLGYGNAFSLAPDGTFTVLHEFTGGSDGASPLAGLITDGKNRLLGTAYMGGAYGYGVVFEMKK